MSNTDQQALRKGKVRDIYRGEKGLVLVTTDRVSAFDKVLPNEIPGKGKILQSFTKNWLEVLDVPNHLISTNLADAGWWFATQPDVYAGRTMVVKECDVVPYEFIVRGHIDGSMWRSYERTGRFMDSNLPAGLKRGQVLEKPVLTPSTKSQEGHDINITYNDMVRRTKFGPQLSSYAISIYKRAYQYAEKRGVYIADTKFEFGQSGENLFLIDEVLTPDSSRFYLTNMHRPGDVQTAFDKQIVRNWLEKNWPESVREHEPTPPALPSDVVEQVVENYNLIHKKLFGSTV